MKKLIIPILILYSITCFSQTYEEKAKVKFIEAQHAFDNGEYQTAITDLKSAISFLGETKPIIQALLVKSYFKMDKLEMAKNENEKYFEFSVPERNNQELDREMISLGEELDKEIQNQKIAAIKNRKDQEAWDKAISENTKESFELYEQLHPYGKYISEAKYKIDYLSVNYSTNPYVLKKHIDKYPQKPKTNKIREKYYYYNAVERNYVEDYKKYLEKYPYGEYVNSVKRSLTDYYYSQAKKDFNNSYYDATSTSINMFFKYNTEKSSYRVNEMNNLRTKISKVKDAKKQAQRDELYAKAKKSSLKGVGNLLLAGGSGAIAYVGIDRVIKNQDSMDWGNLAVGAIFGGICINRIFKAKSNFGNANMLKRRAYNITNLQVKPYYNTQHNATGISVAINF